jgi:hypothetical protein
LVDKIAGIDSALSRLEINRQNDLRNLSSNVAKSIREELEAQKLLNDIVRNAETVREKQGEESPEAGGGSTEDIMLFELESVQKMVSTSAGIIPPNIVTAMRKIQDQGPEYESDLEFLESLHFPDIKARERGVKNAQFKTFEWILEPEKYRLEQRAVRRQKPLARGGQGSTEQRNFDAFASWLEKEDRIFWIHGKPGCGKSTLMKFVCSNPKTEKKLRVWASPKKLAIAHYFFWRAGSTLQKTQQGLLRSLVFEMIRECPELLSVAKTTLPKTNIFDSRHERWTKDQLLKTYKAMVSQTLATRFCFFIDGLDEYYDSERNPEDLVKTIRELDLSSDVKLCISSRPYPIFVEQFGQDQSLERVLKVEDYTRGDIRHYVEERFKASGNFIQLQQIDGTYANFVDEVSDIAQGVFLWVVLVVADLEEGLKNGDSVHSLRKRLNSYPPDLDEFFLQMLKRIDAGYRKQAMRTFEMATSALRPLHAMLFWYLYELDEDPKCAPMRKNTQPLRDNEVKELLTQLRRQLQARSRGLLEIVEDGDHADAFFKYKLDFIHRTVRDFLSTSEAVKAQFRSELKNERRTTWISACYAINSLLQVAPYTSSDMQEEDFMKNLVKDLYFYANRAHHCEDRSVSEEEAKKVVDAGQSQCDQRVMIFNRNQKQHQQHPHRLFRHRLFLCLDAQYNFSDNLKKRIDKHGKSLKINGDGERPVLDCALVEIPGEGPLQYSQEIVKLLLKNGADPTSVYQDNMTVWQRFVVHLAEGPVEAPPQYWQTRVAILKLLLDKRDWLLSAIVKFGGRQETAEAVLGEVLPKEELAQIPQLKKKEPRWFKNWLPR